MAWEKRKAAPGSPGYYCRTVRTPDGFRREYVGTGVAGAMCQIIDGLVQTQREKLRAAAREFQRRDAELRTMIRRHEQLTNLLLATTLLAAGLSEPSRSLLPRRLELGSLPPEVPDSGSVRQLHGLVRSLRRIERPPTVAELAVLREGREVLREVVLNCGQALRRTVLARVPGADAELRLRLNEAAEELAGRLAGELPQPDVRLQAEQAATWWLVTVLDRAIVDRARSMVHWRPKSLEQNSDASVERFRRALRTLHEVRRLLDGPPAGGQ